jgi:hypothetical protein
LESESNKTEAEEAEFRENYSQQLRGKKQQVYDSQMGHNALEEERKQVNQQAMKTSGRRGEIIKNEEIDKEFSKRYFEHKKKESSLLAMLNIIKSSLIYSAGKR